MDAELKAKWSTALRSGKYSQAQGALRAPDGYCCLGVLCDVIDPNGWNLARGDGTQTHKLSAGVLLSSDTLAALEFGDHVHVQLAHMNDGGSSFKAIADYIDSNDMGVPASMSAGESK